MSLTREHIAYHAALHPSDIAVIDHDRRYSYAQFDRDLDRYIRALNAFEVRPGQVAAVEWTSLYNHWLLLLAFETLGVATYSYAHENLRSIQPYLDKVDLVLHTERAVPEGPVRAHAVTQAWADEVSALEPDPAIAGAGFSLDAPMRIHFSSGTTGAPKRIVKTQRVHEFWVWQNLVKAGCSRETRYLVTQSFCLLGTYYFATACLRMGGTVIFDARDRLHAITEHGVTGLTLLPQTLAQVVDRLPADFAKPPSLTVYTFGGHVTEALRARTLDRFATAIVESYGANEVGSITIVGPDGIGAMLPGTAVQVLDEADRPVIGAPGRIRVRSGGSIGHYPDDPEATANMFDDGWFYPGDIGELTAPRRLRLLGRDDDLINRGGLKLRPETVEDLIARQDGIADVCVTAIGAEDDADPELWAAVVLEDGTDLATIRDTVAPLLSRNWQGLRFTAVDSIPRTANGKAQRNVLADTLRENGAAGQQDPDPAA